MSACMYGYLDPLMPWLQAWVQRGQPRRRRLARASANIQNQMMRSCPTDIACILALGGCAYTSSLMPWQGVACSEMQVLDWAQKTCLATSSRLSPWAALLLPVLLRAGLLPLLVGSRHSRFDAGAERRVEDFSLCTVATKQLEGAPYLSPSLRIDISKDCHSSRTALPPQHVALSIPCLSDRPPGSCICKQADTQSWLLARGPCI